MGSTFGDAI